MLYNTRKHLIKSPFCKVCNKPLLDKNLNKISKTSFCCEEHRREWDRKVQRNWIKAKRNKLKNSPKFMETKTIYLTRYAFYLESDRPDYIPSIYREVDAGSKEEAVDIFMNEFPRIDRQTIFANTNIIKS